MRIKSEEYILGIYNQCIKRNEHIEESNFDNSSFWIVNICSYNGIKV